MVDGCVCDGGVCVCVVCVREWIHLTFHKLWMVLPQENPHFFKILNVHVRNKFQRAEKDCPRNLLDFLQNVSRCQASEHTTHTQPTTHTPYRNFLSG